MFFFSSPLKASQKSPKIVVVGAGLSGLTTAYRLHQSGFDVEVYEARNRVGGRVFSVEVCGHIGELGGQNLLDGGEAKNLFSLINELDLEVEERKSALRIKYYDDGKLFDIQQLLQHREFTREMLDSKFKNIAKTARNMKEALLTFFDEKDILYKSLSYLVCSYEGASIEQLSTFYLPTLYHMLLGGLCSAHQGIEEEAVYLDRWVKGGNSVLAEKMSEGLRLYLNSPLQAIRKSDDRYELAFKNGNQVSADILILAIPSSVHQDIEIDPQVIPLRKQLEIRAIEYGNGGKILIPVAYIAFQKHAAINGRMGLHINGDGHLMSLLYNGEYGKFTAETIDKAFQRELSFVRDLHTLESSKSPVMASDESFAHYSGPVGHSWPNDPYAKGSYSCIAPGQEMLLTSTETIAGEEVRSLFAPIDSTLFFTGEHASILFDVGGTMEAAVEAGERTARIIKKLHNSHFNRND